MESKYNYDYLLENYIGGAGKWQLIQYSLLLLQSAASAIPFFLYMYSTFSPPHRCFVSICDNYPPGNASYTEPWTSFAIPEEKESEGFLKENEALSQCSMYPIKEGAVDCSPNSFDNRSTLPCSAYIYDRSIFEETLTTELDLVCDSDYKVNFIGTIMMVGLLVGSILGGPLSDRVGRKRTLTAALCLMGPLVIIEGFVVNYIAFIVLRFIIWTSICIMWISSHAMVVELFSKEYRKQAFIFSSLLLPIYCTIMIGIVYMERHWSLMHLWVGIIVCSTAPFLVFFLKESVRWLITNGRLNEAESILLKAAKTNRHRLTEDEVHEVRHMIGNIAQENEGSVAGLGFVFNMFKGQLLPRTLILMGLWITTVLSYYALTLNATSLAGNIFLNFILSFVADMPSCLFIYAFVDRLGRRYSITLAHSMLGAGCITMAFLPKSQSQTIMAMYLMGKFASSVSMNVLWLYTAELFPTNLRAQAVGLCSMVARIFGMTAPFIAKLGSIWPPLPMLVLGVPALVCGWLTILLPETTGRDLMEIKDVKKKNENQNVLKL